MPTSWPHFQTSGAAALAFWHELRAQDRGWPIIVGDDEALEHFERLAELPNGRSPQDILAAASVVDVSALEAELARGSISVDDLFATVGRAPPPNSALPPDLLAALAAVNAKTYEPPVIREPTVAHDRGDPLARVHVLLTPAREGFEVPAFARWGDWNGCPSPEHHVARLRDWGERFGADLIGMSHDTLELRIGRPPKGKDEAMALAKEHIGYCPDNTPQAPDTLESYADSLLRHDWWRFWWD